MTLNVNHDSNGNTTIDTDIPSVNHILWGQDEGVRVRRENAPEAVREIMEDIQDRWPQAFETMTFKNADWEVN